MRLTQADASPVPEDEDEALEETLAATTRRPGATGVAWQIASGIGPVAQVAPPPVGAPKHHAGGCAFDIDVARPAPRGGRRLSREKPAAAPAPEHPGAAKAHAHAAAERCGGGGGGGGSGLPQMQQLLSEAPTLSSKIETLRQHLEERLGGCAALQRVYDYCCREENGVQEDGEREAMLAFMAGKQELLPLVHTLLYLEETLEMRGGS